MFTPRPVDLCSFGDKFYLVKRSPFHNWGCEFSPNLHSEFIVSTHNSILAALAAYNRALEQAGAVA